MVKLRLLSNVSTGRNKDGEDVTYKAGQIVEGFTDEVADSLVKNGAAVVFEEVQQVELEQPPAGDTQTPPQE